MQNSSYVNFDCAFSESYTGGLNVAEAFDSCQIIFSVSRPAFACLPFPGLGAATKTGWTGCGHRPRGVDGTRPRAQVPLSSNSPRFFRSDRAAFSDVASDSSDTGSGGTIRNIPATSPIPAAGNRATTTPTTSPKLSPFAAV